MFNKNNKEDKTKTKLKRLKSMYWVLVGLTGAFSVLLISFFVIIIISGTSKPATPETPVKSSVYITSQTQVHAFEVCVNTEEIYENPELADEIRNLDIPNLQGLKSLLLYENIPLEAIKLFTPEQVVVEYPIDNCEKCLDDSVYLAIRDAKITFYEGIPHEDNEIGAIKEEVLVIDLDQKKSLEKGISVDESDLHLGMHTGTSLAVYSGEPSDVRLPLFIFKDLTVQADIIYFLNEEGSFNTMEELLDLIETYAH